MNTTLDRRRVRRTWLMIGLLFVATPLAGGIWALLFPRAFYEGFPLPGSGWVSTLGPYNEHLVRDYGALNLAMAVLLLAAATLTQAAPGRVALITWLVFGATLHLPPGTDPSLLCGEQRRATERPSSADCAAVGLLFLLPQEAAGRDLGHVNNVDRTERIETR